MSDGLRILIAILIFGVLVTLYIGSYVLNKRTKKPEGCGDFTSSCTGCAVSTCGHSKKKED